MSELEQLRDKVEQLQAALGMNIALPNVFGMTPIKEKILGLLIKREIVSREMFLDALYAGKATEPDPKTVEVHLSRVRRMIAPYEVSIKNRFGVGWYIPAADKLKLKTLMETA